MRWICIRKKVNSLKMSRPESRLSIARQTIDQKTIHQVHHYMQQTEENM